MNKLTTSLLSLSLGFALVSNSFAQKIYWADFGMSKIQRSDLDGSNVEDLISSGLNGPSGIALDLTNSKMYWADYNANKIQRADIDGSNVEDLVTTGLNLAFGLELDLTNSKIYWANSGNNKIQRANLDGSNVEDLISTGSSLPHKIALDLTNSKIYWSGSNDKIQRADLDGSNIEDLVTSSGDTYGIALDIASSKVYWSINGQKIQRANLDGSNIEDVITGLISPYGIELDLVSSKIYFIDNDRIKRANLDGSNIEDIFIGGLITEMALDIADAPLSVELNSFSARQIENSIQLNWSTASETENEGFNIYRKLGENDFVQIASHKSHKELKGQGNTSAQIFYSFTDNSELLTGELYTYIISDVETNGLETKHEENAQTVFFEVKTQSVKRFELAQNFPNPFN
ncbi:MAG: DUF5050 domain-containing protein, partial [Calditrichaeota bacterium]